MEAKQEFTRCFGELSLRHITEGVVLPHFSDEFIEMEQFIESHQEPAPVVVPLEKVDLCDSTGYFPSKYYYE